MASPAGSNRVVARKQRLPFPLRGLADDWLRIERVDDEAHAMRRSTLATIALSFFLIAPGSAAQGTSALWGHAGEDWNPLGRLPDFSYAGYMRGERPLPNPPVVANVLDFGARGDGVSNDVQAFRDAIAYAGSIGGGAVYAPPGTYRIPDILELKSDRVVLRGAGSGPGGTTLFFPNHLRGLTGKQAPWNAGEGGLLWIGTRAGHVPGLGPFLTNVTGAQVRGDRQLRLASTSGIAPGEVVLLRLADPGDDSLGRHLHNEQANPGNCSWQPLPVYWPVQVKSVSGPVLELAQPLRLDVRLSWSPKIYRFLPVREAGLEGVTLRCQPHSYPGHLLEDGYNPVTFQAALNCWMRDVAVENADNGPSFNGLTKNCTAQGVTVRGPFEGHHTFSFIEGAADNLLEDFAVDSVFIHGVTVDHFPSGNVIRRGVGADLNLDHHRDAAFENLFTGVDIGFGSSVWASGGSACAGPHAAARNTYWNMSGPWAYAPPDPEWVEIQSNLVPGRTNALTVNNSWSEVIVEPTPHDLYASQLQRRLDLEVLQRAAHTVATFEDRTLGALGQEQGEPPVFAASALLVAGTQLARFVDPTGKYDNQVILLQIPPGLPSGADVGVAVRAADAGVVPSQLTRVYVEGRGTGELASHVVVILQSPNGVSSVSPPLFVDPQVTSLALRVLVEGNRVQAVLNDGLVLDVNGVPRPAGGGFTSFFAERNAANPGGLMGFLQAKVHASDQGTEIHLDRQGTTWITLDQPGLFAGAFDSGSFRLTIDGTLQLDFTSFLLLAWPGLVNAIEPLSIDHATFGVRLPLPPGTHLRLEYAGASDEAFIPWW